MSTDARAIELDDRQKANLAAVSDEVGKPWSVVFDEALSVYRRRTLPKVPPGSNFFEAATRLGLIGCVKGGPPDLSTNPDHMEGFGRDDR